MIQRASQTAFILLVTIALSGCGGAAQPAGKDGAKATAVAITTGKSMTGAGLDTMLNDPKVGDFFAIDGNKFLLEFDSATTPEEASEPAFGILRVTSVTGATVSFDMFSELFTESVNLDEALGNGTLIDMKRYDNDPETLLRNRVVSWGTKGIASAGLRK